MNLESTLARIVESIDYLKMVDRPKQGQFVVTGPNFNGNQGRVGYCVQIRVSVGQFGSDMVFLRHADGSLVIHENQCYIAMSEEQESLARSVFIVSPECEEYELGYSDCLKVHEVGFIIENSKSRGTPDTPFTIAIMKSSGKGAA
ncbi:plasmid protein [Jejubacter calystegiae]|uniref:Plasmid protein n=1 Tax=Jejubacter calystegiae TaxID=2579935 RepID=A0A4P8YSP1_9ENTR|nr:plasmid protein [Jejubacter calystegiae]QCT21812.1 plasmid protein [Jejubacter calystegiae]